MSETEGGAPSLKDGLRRWAHVYKSWTKTDEYVEWNKERQERVSRYGQLLSRQSIASMTEAEVYELVSSLWAFGGWGNKDYLVDRLLKATAMEKFKKSLMQLLWGSEVLGKRYDDFNNGVKYLGSAAITEILASVHPDKCAIWNERARVGLQKIGLLEDLVGKYWVGGGEYERICDEYKRILARLQGEGVGAEDLLDVDLFLYRLSVIGDLEEEPRRGDYDFSHDEVKERILEVGQYLGFEAEKEVPVAKGAKVDAVWTVHLGNLGVVKYVFEVQRAGSVDSLLLNLQKARRNPGVQKEIVVSNTEGLDRVRREAEGLGEDFARSLAYLEAADVVKMARSLAEVWEIIAGLELVKSGEVRAAR